MSEGISIDNNNFAFKVKVILGFKSTRPGGYVVKTWLNGPMTNRVKVQKLFWGLLIYTNMSCFLLSCLTIIFGHIDRPQTDIWTHRSS